MHGNTPDMLTPRMPAVQCGLLCHLAVPQSCRSDAADCGLVLFPLENLRMVTVVISPLHLKPLNERNRLISAIVVKLSRRNNR
jgi:hypothetical protein